MRAAGELRMGIISRLLRFRRLRLLLGASCCDEMVYDRIEAMLSANDDLSADYLAQLIGQALLYDKLTVP